MNPQTEKNIKKMEQNIQVIRKKNNAERWSQKKFDIFQTSAEKNCQKKKIKSTVCQYLKETEIIEEQ